MCEQWRSYRHQRICFWSIRCVLVFPGWDFCCCPDMLCNPFSSVLWCVLDYGVNSEKHKVEIALCACVFRQLAGWTSKIILCLHAFVSSFCKYEYECSWNSQLSLLASANLSYCLELEFAYSPGWSFWVFLWKSWPLCYLATAFHSLLGTVAL